MHTFTDPVFFTAILTAISLGAILSFLCWIVFNAQRRFFIQRQKVCTRELDTLRQERLRIARDLHDELGPTLQLVYRQVAAIAHQNSGQKELAVSARNLLEVSIRRVGEISKNMEDHRIIKNGLKQSIERYISQHSMACQLYFQFHYQLTKEPPPLIVSSLYRILLELINNTIRHAEATISIINFREQRNTLYFYYADNGNGFHPSLLKEGEGSGLSNLQYRVSLLGGLLETKTINGASFLVSIPLH
ncbi:histidine kinase [Niabella yanshanensis]|uniref:histidine kinase n=1 Tax=Niabella yanshanensis TaxID=577386 RepID=A0ABZ0W952_9BACT|nr:ATP-binding protein [Niabella yanshanensis]WQD39199.1 histidine kinase [Niabella yanshanensis]